MSGFMNFVLVYCSDSARLCEEGTAPEHQRALGEEDLNLTHTHMITLKFLFIIILNIIGKKTTQLYMYKVIISYRPDINNYAHTLCMCVHVLAK